MRLIQGNVAKKLNVVLPLIPASWFVYLFSWQCLFAYTNLQHQELMLYLVYLSGLTALLPPV